MGLIRSGYTNLTPEEDSELTAYLWPIAREMIKTAIENDQNLIVEGCYIPLDWKKAFSEGYLDHIRFYCLIMTEAYIRKHFSDIKGYADIVEKRLDDGDLTPEKVVEDNATFLDFARLYPDNVLWIDDAYNIAIDLL